MGGMAAAILCASVCMVGVPAALFGAAGFVAFRGRTVPRWARDEESADVQQPRPAARRGAIGAVVGALVGVAAGTIAVVSTFFERDWSPPVELMLEVPEGFGHDEVVVLEDRGSSNDFEWSGVDAPFTARSARLAVPASGVVRVRSLQELHGHAFEAKLSTGPFMHGLRMGPLAPGVGTGQAVVLSFRPWHPGVVELPQEPAAFVEAVLAREREGR